MDPDTLHEELKILLVADSDTVPSRKACLTVLMDNENLDFERDYLVEDFTPQIRPLHHIANKIFFLKVGRMDFVGQWDLNIMYHILLEKPTDLSRMIMSYMMDQKNRKSDSLPYIMLLIELFENAEIDLSIEVSQKLIHSDIYSEKSLKRMGFIKIEGL